MYLFANPIKHLATQAFSNIARASQPTSRQVAIVGAGQAGLCLAIALRKLGHAVSIFTNRSADDIRNGAIMSSQGMFHSALDIERELGIDFWKGQAPQNKTVTFTLARPGLSEIGIRWRGNASHPYHSIDQRLKFPELMAEFQRLGGQVIIEDVGLAELDKIAKWNELTVVSAGKGEVSKLFSTDHLKTVHTTPQRALSCLYVSGTKPAETLGVRGNIIPGVGEFFVIPGLTFSGHCEMMLFEGIPGGALDCWQNIKNPDDQFDLALKLLRKYVPWEAERFESAKPTDSKAGLVGRYAPIIRHPVIILPCGKSAIGMGDSVVLNDPIAGQGANNAAKAAALFAARIAERGNKPFDVNWMKETHEMYWDQYAKWATRWSTMLLAPPPPHVIELLASAMKHQRLADMLANGFNDPSTLFPWIDNPDETKRIIAVMDREAANIVTASNDSNYSESQPRMRPS